MAVTDAYAGEEARTPQVRRVNLSLTEYESLNLVGAVKNLFYKARATRRPLVAQWQKNYRMLRNRTWVSGRADWMPSPEVPEIYPIVTSMVGWMTDQRPQLQVAPFASPHSEFYETFSVAAHDLEIAIYSCWLNNQWDAEVEKSLWDAWVYGTGIFKAVWDDALDEGLGNAALRRVDPFTFYPDPQGTSMKDCNYFIEARTMSLQEMDRRWPGSADKLREGMVEDVDEAPRRTDYTSGQAKANPGAIAPATTPRYGQPGNARVHATDDPGITVFECWLREHEIVEGEKDDDIRVYDTWRVVVVAGNEVLEDARADELWSHGRHPYVRYVPHEVGEFWGFSMVEMLAPSQLSINRLLAALQLNVELVGNPVFKEGSRSGLQRTRITNKPGTRVSVNENSTSEWMQPPQVHPMMFQLITFYISEMERISGLSAITRGSTPAGRNAQGVLDSVQEASFVRIRMALRNLEYSLREVGQLVSSLIVEYYTEPRFISILGPEGDRSAKILRAKHFYVPTAKGTVPMKYTLMVNAGSALSTSPQARRADAIQLLTLGAMDPQGVLEAFNWPNRQEIVKRLNAMAQAGMTAGPGKRERARAA